MGILFIILAAISLIALIVGFVWLLVGGGEKTRRSGEAVGAQMMRDQIDDDDGESNVVGTTIFKGKASKVEVSASVSFKDIKDAVALGDWRGVLPALLGMGGLFGLLFFGALAIFFIVEDKLIGGIVLAFVVFSLTRVVLDFARA